MPPAVVNYQGSAALSVDYLEAGHLRIVSLAAERQLLHTAKPMRSICEALRSLRMTHTTANRRKVTGYERHHTASTDICRSRSHTDRGHVGRQLCSCGNLGCGILI